MGFNLQRARAFISLDQSVLSWVRGQLAVIEIRMKLLKLPRIGLLISGNIRNDRTFSR